MQNTSYPDLAYIINSITMFLWYPVMDFARAPRRAPLTALKKGSGYENGSIQKNYYWTLSTSAAEIT